MIDSIIARLASPSEKIRAHAAYRLAKSHDECAVQALLRALRDPSPRVRRQAAYSLSTICPSSAVEPLIDALRDSDPETCRRVALTLGKIGSTDAVDPLINLFFRDNAELHFAAQKALIRIGQPAVTALTTLYDSSDIHLRALAVQTLGRIGDLQAIGIFIRALRDPDKWIRWMTASIARSIPDEQWIDALSALLDDEFMRWNAARALGYVGNEGTVDILAEIVCNASRDKPLRMIAKEAIHQIRQRQKTT